MIYIVGLIRKGIGATGEILRYNILETISESSMTVTPNQLKSIITDTKLKVANATLENNKIKLKDWVNKITVKLSGDINSNMLGKYSEDINLHDYRCPYILLNKEGDRYKLTNYKGIVRDIPLDELETIVKLGEIANCSMTNNKDETSIDWRDTYEIIANEEFEKDILIKYNTFIAKAQMFSHGSISFKYRIENKQVILQRFTGSSRNIILPSFITAVMSGAFDNSYVDTLDLNEGLKIISTKAFMQKGMTAELEKIEIPSTVELIGPNAFLGHTRLYNNQGELSPHKIKLRNIKTLIIER